MFDINKIIKTKQKIICIGSYPAIIQSILDFDYSSGKNEPSIVGIVAAGRKFERYFFGRKEILIPVYSSVEKINEDKRRSITYFLNLGSGRRVLTSTTEAIIRVVPRP